jgi:hypothetical protein
LLYPRNGVSVLWDEFEIALIARSWTGELPGFLVVLLYLVFDLWGALTDRSSGIGYGCHIAGALFGIGLAVVLLKAGWLAPERGEQTLLQWLGGDSPVPAGTPGRRPRRQKDRLEEAATGQGE